MEYKKIKDFFLSMVLVIVFVACNSVGHKTQGKIEVHKNSSGEKKSVEILAPAEFKTRLKNTEKAQLIDVRTPYEYESGSIKKARNYDISNANFEKNIAALDKEKPVFVYCAKGGRSRRAAEYLKNKGFNSVVDLKGGYSAWIGVK